jgi:hypothetical protein
MKKYLAKPGVKCVWPALRMLIPRHKVAVLFGDSDILSAEALRLT